MLKSEKIKKILSVFLAVLLIFSFVACQKKDTRTDEQKIRDRINTFVEEYNSGNVEEMFSCMDKRQRKLFETIYSIVGGLFKLIPYVGNTIDFADIYSLSFTVTDGEILELEIIEIIMVDEENATVVAKMGYNIGYGGFTAVDETAEVYLPMVKENDDWYIHDLTDDIRKVNVKEYTRFDIVERGDYHGGISQIEYLRNGVPQYGLIDTEGRILHSSDDVILGQSMGNGCVIFLEDNISTQNKTCTILHPDGKRIDPAIAIDAIFASGDGYSLVYQQKNRITHMEHLYGIINTDGEFILPMTDIVDPKEYTFSYGGDGVFFAEKRVSEETSGIVFFDAKDGSCYRIDGENIIQGEFANGVSYGRNGARITYYGEKGSRSLPASYRLGHGGVITAVDEIGDVIAGGAVRIRNGYYEFVCGDKSFVYEGYPAKYVSDFKFFGEYVLVLLNGIEEQQFFTVIDSNGKERFDPIAYVEDARISDGAVVYKIQTEQENTGCYLAVDFDGKPLWEGEIRFDFIGDFSDGIAKIIYGEKSFYINLKGEKILLELK